MENHQNNYGEEFKRDWNKFIKCGRAYVGSIGILEDAELSCQARILFHIISSLSYKKGYCYATNKTFAAKLGLQETMVKKYLRELEQKELIITKTANIGGFKRNIYLNFDELEARYLKAENEIDTGNSKEHKYAALRKPVSTKTKTSMEEVKARISKGRK